MIAVNSTLLPRLEKSVSGARVRAYARRKVLWLKHLWSASLVEAERGMAISHGEIDRILVPPPDMAAAEDNFYASDPEARQISAHLKEADCAWAADPLWLKLRRFFGLSDAECDLLALAVAVEDDPDLRRLYGYLNDDATASYPTPWLASHLFRWPPGRMVGSNSALMTWGMVRLVESQGASWTTASPYQADPEIASWLAGDRTLDTSLGSALELRERYTVQDLDSLYPEQLVDMLAFANAAKSEFVEIELIGPEGSGKLTLGAQFAARLGADLLAADAATLLTGEIPPALGRERTMRVVRNARLLGAIPYWRRADQVDIVLEAKWMGPTKEIALLGRAARRPRGHTASARRSFSLPGLTRQQRIALWSQLSTVAPPAAVTEWVLTPFELAAASRVADAGLEAVTESCRGVVQGSAAELFTPLPCPFTWDDIVLAPGVRRHLLEFEAQARLRWQVYEEWGFGALCPLGRGITALFAGPSGSGKTMAAQVLARSLGMDLYRVDLAGVMNKYIGETEKRLKQVFDSCERVNVVLLFDEADALFGQRTQVKDAHDRFANIEIDYLLQRMEQFDGIAILATNRKGDLDKAFVRRLRFIVDFMHPGIEERLTLWRMSLHEHAPSGERLLGGVDWQFLAERIVMSAADIKLAALGAAFLARSEGSRIGMRHLLAACRRELAKQGVELRGGDLAP